MFTNNQYCRRTLFAGAGVVAGATCLGGLLDKTGHATENFEPSTVPIRFEAAALTAAVRGSAVLGDRVYIASRHNVAEGTMRLGVVDPRSGELLEAHDLNLGGRSGNNALAADDRYIYIGLAGGSHVWRFDPATKAVEPFFEIGDASTWVYAMRVVGDYLYVGNFPKSELFKVDLGTGKSVAFGQVGDSQYAVTVAADEDMVVGGTAAPGALKVYNHDGSLRHDLTSELDESPVGTLDVAISAGTIYVSCGRFIISMKPDGTQRVVRPIEKEDRYVDKLCVMPDGRVLALARLTSNFYEVTPTGMTHLGKPWNDVENQGFFPDGNEYLIGVTGLGHVWRTKIGGESKVFPMAKTKFGYPESAQSLLAHSSGAVWVGGHYSITVHRPKPGSTQQPDSKLMQVNGEPKSMVETTDGTVVAGMYPSTSLIAISPDGSSQRVLGTIDNEQMRPLAMAYDKVRGDVLVPTTGKHQVHTGALTFVNPNTGAFEVRRDILPDQNLRNIAIAGDFAYLGGDTYAEAKDTQGPVQVASIAELDLRTRKVVRELKPVEWASYEDVAVVDGVLYALGRRPRGAWFTMDLAMEKILTSGEMSEEGALHVSKGRVFLVSKVTQQIIELTPDRINADRVLYSNLNITMYNRPEFATVDGELGLWGVDDLKLTWFPLPEEPARETPTPTPEPPASAEESTPTSPPVGDGQGPGLPSTGY